MAGPARDPRDARDARGPRDIPFEERPSDGRGGRVVPMRLQKFLARAGVASRRASEGLMTAGRVSVNGVVVRELGFKVDPLLDEVALDGRPVRLGEGATTLMLNKPAGVITTMKAQSARPIVADLVPRERYPGLFPVGRLDADTTGLLLFTTDGELGNALLHPSRHVPKTYLAHLARPLSPRAAHALERGVQLDDGPALPAELSFAGVERRAVRITVHEGRYHQVKRMFEAVGNSVSALHREQFGPLALGPLACGRWRALEEAELKALREAARGNGVLE